LILSSFTKSTAYIMIFVYEIAIETRVQKLTLVILDFHLALKQEVLLSILYHMQPA
jgi:hypothetical protein